jgi:probable lipoprotein NlpC
VTAEIRLAALAALLALSACATLGAAVPPPPEPAVAIAATPADEGARPEPEPEAVAARAVPEAVWEPPAFDARGAVPSTARAASEERARARIVRAARALVGRRLKTDCSGFVLRVMREARVPVRLGTAPSRSESLFRASRVVEAPRPGDLAFFHDTYDRNHDRRANDRFTHVGLVEEVDGTALVLVHRAVHGVERLRMDLARPDDPDANDRLRFQRRSDAPGTRYLAGELFAAFGELLGGEFTRMLQASRTSGSDQRHPARR